MIDHALKYAAQGFAVFPCWPRTKKPATRRGFYEATTNPAALRRWFSGVQQYNIAVRTGMASHCWILDVDDPASLENVVAKYGPLPLTRQSQASRGVHYWWRTDVPVFCGNSRIAAGLDVKGDGGFIMVPPSVHPNGSIYRWLNDAPLVVAPDWLLALARKRPEPNLVLERSSRKHNGPPGSYGAAALESEIKALASAPRGTRNPQLNCTSFRLHQLVAGDELSRDEVEACLIEACKANGLWADDGPRQVMATIRSGACAGLQHPRARGPRE
jgi:Bifunctional DNA primase/polymerase, N-terminal